MPPVQVALKLLAKGKPVRAKDVMPYIVTGSNSGSQESAASNSFPPDEVMRRDSGLKPDVEYYLHKQILPPVERLCAPVALTNITRIADCLGLDTTKYRVSSAGGAGAGQGEDALLQPLDSQVPDEIRFAECAPLRFHCLNRACRAAFRFASLASDASAVSHAGIACPTCRKPLANLAAVAQLEHQIRVLLSRYYEGWLVCDDPSCGNRTRQMSVYGSRCLGPRGLGRGCLGRVRWELGEKSVWNQLVCWERAFDVDRTKGGLKGRDGDGEDEKVRVLAEINRERFGTLRGVVKGYLDRSGRQWVDMGGLFGFVR